MPHTKAPWKIAHSGYANTPFVVYAGAKEPQFANRNKFPLQGVEWIAEVKHDESPAHPEQIANIHLIGAAPELLAALKSALPLMVGALAFVDCKEQLRSAEAAIAKAEGRG